MVDHSAIRRAKEIADRIGLSGQEGGQIHQAVYYNDSLIDVLGSQEVEQLQTDLRHLDHYIASLSKESDTEISDPDFLISKDALLDDIKNWFETRTHAEPATERLMGRIAEFIRASEQTDDSPFKKLFDQFSNGGEFSVDTREIDGDFQQRAVLKGTWESVEKPSGLS